MITAQEMGKKGGQARSDAKAVAARANAKQPRAQKLPQWMTTFAAMRPEDAALLQSAAKVVRELSRQVRADGHTEYARYAIKIAESLEVAAHGRATWAQAFDLE